MTQHPVNKQVCLTSRSKKAEGALLGLAIGDCLGVPLEFMKRDKFPLVVDLIGGGVFNLPIGAWTDDTSMALCLGKSLVEYGAFDAADQLDRYLAWYKTGYLSSTGNCFDIGNTTQIALTNYRQTQKISGLTHERSAGNGSLMRLVPIPLFFHQDIDQAIYYAKESSKTTHAHPLCIESCALFCAIVWDALNETFDTKESLLQNRHHLVRDQRLLNIVNMDYQYKARHQISSSGYVLDSLEAALWAFWHTDSFEQALICAANLADDSDTVAAICGQLAGAFYGIEAIPERWLNLLYEREMITSLAHELVSVSPTNN